MSEKPEFVVCDHPSIPEINVDIGENKTLCLCMDCVRVIVMKYMEHHWKETSKHFTIRDTFRMGGMRGL